jgi:serine/threonine protein phosphatase PrpC
MKVQWIGIAHGTETIGYDFDNVGLSDGHHVKFRTDTELKTGDGIARILPLIAVIGSGNPKTNKPYSASRMVVKELIQRFRNDCKTERFPDLNYERWLIFQFEEIHKTLIAYGEANPGYRGLSASCTCIIVEDTTAYIAQLGNTHIYQMRNKIVTDLSTGGLLELPAEYCFFKSSAARRTDPQSYSKTTIGALDQEWREPHVFLVDVQKNDILGLCTEGVDTAVGEDGFRSFFQKVRSHYGLGKAARRMIDESRKHCDNNCVGALLLRLC